MKLFILVMIFYLRTALVSVGIFFLVLFFGLGLYILVVLLVCMIFFYWKEMQQLFMMISGDLCSKSMHPDSTMMCVTRLISIHTFNQLCLFSINLLIGGIFQFNSPNRCNAIFCHKIDLNFIENYPRKKKTTHAHINHKIQKKCIDIDTHIQWERWNLTALNNRLLPGIDVFQSTQIRNVYLIVTRTFRTCTTWTPFQ